ncbi:hypothetical protein NNL21_35215 [Paenibacillus mendelii]|nr:hypothetical protein [Paenibacillus mendelii]
MHTPAKPPQVISSWDAHVNLDQADDKNTSVPSANITEEELTQKRN